MQESFECVSMAQREFMVSPSPSSSPAGLDNDNNNEFNGMQVPACRQDSRETNGRSPLRGVAA